MTVYNTTSINREQKRPHHTLSAYFWLGQWANSTVTEVYHNVAIKLKYLKCSAI
jgi:hypothetical protein